MPPEDRRDSEYSIWNDSFGGYGYGFSTDYSLDHFDVVLPDFSELQTRIKEIEEERRLRALLENKKKFGEIWIQNTTNRVLLVPILNVGLPIAEPINLMEYTDVNFLKENALTIFDWIQQQSGVSVWYHKPNERPIIGAENIKNVVTGFNPEEKENNIDDFTDLIEL